VRWQLRWKATKRCGATSWLTFPTNCASLIVLAGSALPSTKAAPSNPGMPAFGWRLSDDETAQLVTFVRQSWGKAASAASAGDAAVVRCCAFRILAVHSQLYCCN